MIFFFRQVRRKYLTTYPKLKQLHTGGINFFLELLLLEERDLPSKVKSLKTTSSRNILVGFEPWTTGLQVHLFMLLGLVKWSETTEVWAVFSTLFCWCTLIYEEKKSKLFQGLLQIPVCNYLPVSVHNMMINDSRFEINSPFLI